MNERIVRIVFSSVLLLLLAAPPARAGGKDPQEAVTPPEGEASPAEKADTERGKPSPEEIIRLAESKLYSPLRDGLKDLFFVQKIALGNKYRSFWFKAPDKVKGILGRPNKRPLPPRYAKLFKRTTEPQVPLQESVARRTVWTLLGRPISCLLPYGTFEIIRRDENGVQLRFNADTKDSKNLVWTNIDFYLDKDFRLIRVMQKLVPDGRVEEYRYTLKPVEEGSKYLVVDTRTVISGTKEWQKTAANKYHYRKVGPYWLVDKVEMSLKESKDSDKESYTEKYLDYRVDQGIEEAVFEAKDR